MEIIELENLMSQIDPMLMVSDSALDEALSTDELFKRIEELTLNSSEPSRQTEARGHRTRNSTVWLSAALFVAVVMTGVLAMTASHKSNQLRPRNLTSSGGPDAAIASSGQRYALTGTSQGLRACRPVQLVESLTFRSSSSLVADGLNGTLTFSNVGGVCWLIKTYVGFVAVEGPLHKVVGKGSAVGTMTVGEKMVLEHGDKVSAPILILSTTSANFRSLIAIHGGSCQPKSANGIVVAGLYRGWPSKYFALPGKVPVCTVNWRNASTGSYDNLGSGPIRK